MFFAVIEGAEELAGRWVNVRGAIRAGIRRGVSLGVTEGAAEARANHRFKNQTGDLERSIIGRLTGNRTSVGTSRGRARGIGGRDDSTSLDDNDGAQLGEIAATMPYASYVENGRGPVVAKKARFLRFVIDGVVFFRKRVGPAAPRPFMALAYTKCERVMIRELERAVALAQNILDR